METLTMKKILVIDSELDSLSKIESALLNNNYYVKSCDSTKVALIECAKVSYDMIICELSMDGIDGLTFIDLAKTLNASTISIIISSEQSSEVEIKALQQGSAYFLRKPVNIDLLILQVQRAMEQLSDDSNNNIYHSEIDNITVNIANRVVEKNTVPVKITSLEFNLLTLLISNKNNILSREQIYRSIWNVDKLDYNFDPRLIDVHINRLRKKLELKCIHAERGVGYTWYEK